MYAFAVLLNELLTGNAPWAGLQMYQVTMAVAIEKRRPSVRPAVPDSLLHGVPHISLVFSRCVRCRWLSGFPSRCLA